MSERTRYFAKRVCEEVRDFTVDKGNELADKVRQTVQDGANRVQQGVSTVANRVFTEAETKTYQVALGVVANRHSLTAEEAETRLTTVPVPITTVTTVPVRRTRTRKCTTAS